jgi:hypothetical protein
MEIVTGVLIVIAFAAAFVAAVRYRDSAMRNAYAKAVADARDFGDQAIISGLGEGNRSASEIAYLRKNFTESIRIIAANRGDFEQGPADAARVKAMQLTIELTQDRDKELMEVYAEELRAKAAEGGA